MLVFFTTLLCMVLASVSDAFIINTNGRPPNSEGKIPYFGNFQGYDPVSAEQQGGSPNFQQPNMLTGQKVQIQTATSRPVFGMFGQQQPTQCLPTSPNMQVPSGPSQELFDYFNQLHATTKPFPNNQQQQYGSGIHYGADHHGNNNPPQNPIQQVTGTSGPLAVFSKPDYVPLSMQLTSQQGRPIYITSNNHNDNINNNNNNSNNNNNNDDDNNNNNNQKPVHGGSPLLGTLYEKQNGNQAPSGGPVNQQQPHEQRTTQRPQSGPIGFQPINIGKRSVRVRRDVGSPFNPNQVNRPNVNRSPRGYAGPRQSTSTSDNNNNRMGAPSYFTDPFKYQMDQNNNPVPHRNTGSRQQGILAFSDPSIFTWGSGFGKAQGTGTQSVNIGTQTEGSSSAASKHSHKMNSESAALKDEKEVTSSTSTSSSTHSQGGTHLPQETVNQGGMEDTSSTSNTKESSRKDDQSLIQEVARFDPNKVNLSPFNLFDPSPMISSNGRWKRHALHRRGAEFDPSKMNAGKFDPSKMTAGSYDPTSANGANGANSQNPSSHPVGHFDPSSMPSGSYNPGKGDAGQVNPGSLQQRTPESETPLGQFGAASGGSQTGTDLKPNPQITQGEGEGYDPDHIPSGSSFVPGSGGLFDPSAWEDFIGRK